MATNEKTAEQLEKEKEVLSKNTQYNLLKGRLGYDPSSSFTPNTVEGVNDLATTLRSYGGYRQQERMIKDKRRSLNQAVLYSYQAAFIKKIKEGEDTSPIRALINPDKLKENYDDKIISVGYEHEFQTGDIFDWCNTGTKWIIHLQDMTELAYFRGKIRKCNYQIAWKDTNGVVHREYAAIQGPVETKINFVQKNGISTDVPNHSLNIIMPKNADTLAYFQRYAKFYLDELGANDTPICWRVEAKDSISMPGVLQLTAIEYYSNPMEDDVENGIVGGLIEDPSEMMVMTMMSNEVGGEIQGEGFIKPKRTNRYVYTGEEAGSWYVDPKYPIVRTLLDDKTIELKWNASYSGQFILKYGDLEKTIVVESLF